MAAIGSMIGALVLTHAFWRFVDHTPFLLGFGAVILSSRVAGRQGGLLAVLVGVLGYAWFPPPLPEDSLGRLLLGFVAVSGTFSWIVARRYEIEAALRSSESRLAEAQQLAHIGSWEWNVEDDSEVWSEELYRICGFEPNAFRPTFRSFLDLLHPDDSERVSEYIRRAFQDHHAFEFDHRIVLRPAGHVRTLHSRCRVVLDTAGKVIRMVGTSQDITYRKADEEIVRRSQRRMQTVIDAEPACVKLVSPDGRVLEMNRAGLEMIGARSFAEVVGLPVTNFVHPDDRPQFLRMHHAALEGSPSRLEFRIIGLHGQERWVDSHAVPFEVSSDGSDAQPAVLSVTADITERVRAEQALHDAEERMRFALESSRLGVCEANLRTGDSYWSETCELLHGLERGAFGKTFSAFITCIHPEDREMVRKEIEDAVREHQKAEIEYRTVWPDGTEHRIASTGYFFYDDAGLPLRGAGIATDVTERRLLEAQVQQSQKMEAIGLLAGGIAHDFNNLLTAIGGFTEMVFETLDHDDRRREDLQEVAKAVQRATGLTRQLLAVSRRQVLEPTNLDVNEMVADIHKLLRRTLPESIDFQLQLSPVEPVRADRGQLEQVVLNLAINAGDAMPQGGQLRIATATVDVDESTARQRRPMPTGQYVRLTISDTGIGMTREIQGRIFEPFFTTKEDGKGTGLGLATVYGIVKQSDGFIWVDSEIGRGTTFEVYLPAIHGPVDASVHGEHGGEITGGSETILLVEDDGAVRRLARDVLVNRGYTVLGARDGDEALVMAGRYPGIIHLLVTDVVMPGLSGRDLAARLAVERPNVRVLYMSGYAKNAMIRAGFEEGLTLLTKPFLPVDLLRKVSDILGAHAR